MRNRIIRKSLSTACMLATSLCIIPAHAEWFSKQSPDYYNKKYGDFPPLNIDQQLQDNMKTDSQPAVAQSQSSSKSGTNISSKPASQLPDKDNPVQGSNDQSYEAFLRQRKGRLRDNYSRYNRRSGFGAPWDNNQSSFNMPWGNRGSSFNGPWNNRRSGFSGPWNNRGSGFSGPWDNRGSSFSSPWNNRGSSFSGPWNNRGSGFSFR